MTSFALDPKSLHLLRARLHAAGGRELAAALREAGAASGALLGSRWRDRLGGPGGLQESEQLDVRWFGPVLGEVCAGLGWGSLLVVPIGDEAILLESADWAEAEVGAGEQPGCQFTAGALAAFLSELAGTPLTVLEVECRSAGLAHCRFLVGSQETMAAARDLVTAGRSWRQAFGSTA